MENSQLSTAFTELSTPHLADAALRLAVPLRVGPPTLRPTDAQYRLAGRACPVRHYGSVDIFLEAMNTAHAGDILVIDNGGRMDEACIGDLTVLAAKACGLAGIVTWGLHRDSAELSRIGFPVFSTGTLPLGPTRLDPAHPDALKSARVADFLVTGEDLVFGDVDGIVVIARSHAAQVLSVAKQIATTERKQADELRRGRTLQQQLRFDEYLVRRASDPSYTFRVHLRKIGGAIEE